MLFGPLYWAFKGVWSHAFAMFAIYVITNSAIYSTLWFLPLSFVGFVSGFIWITCNWIIYPLKAKSIIRNSYLKKGWFPL